MLGNKEIMARNILKYMKLKGKTQMEICDELGFKQPTFSDWVNAKTYPRIDKIEMLANYFGINKSDLVEDNSLKADNVTYTSTNPVINEINKILVDDERKAVLALAFLKALKEGDDQ